MKGSMVWIAVVIRSTMTSKKDDMANSPQLRTGRPCSSVARVKWNELALACARDPTNPEGAPTPSTTAVTDELSDAKTLAQYLF